MIQTEQHHGLAPCPFCSGPGVTDFIAGASYAIKCGACQARTFYQASETEAVAAWNRRGVTLPAEPAAPGFLTTTGEVTFRAAPASASIKTWRQRIGASADYQLHAASSVERAMVAQIHDLEEALASTPRAAAAGDTGNWIVLGGQRIGKQALLDLQQDAARYRWLRNKADMLCTSAPMVASLDDAGNLIALIDGDELDAAVDTAMARPARKVRHA